MAFTLITITGQFEQEDGSPASGSVTALLTGRMVNSNIDAEPVPIVGTLDDTGALKAHGGVGAFVLLANDDVGTEPKGVEYTFQVVLDGSPIRAFRANVPSAAPSHTVDLTALEPSE